MVLKPVRTQPPFTRTNRYSWCDRPEVHRLEFLPERGSRVRHVGKKRRMTDNTVRALEQREQFLYQHKKTRDSASPQRVTVDVPKLVPSDTGVAAEKKDSKGIVDRMPESANAFLGDLREPLVGHEASAQTEKPVSGHLSLRSKQRTVIWHLTGSDIVVIQLCLRGTEVSKTSDSKIKLCGELGWIVKVTSHVSPTVPSHVSPEGSPSLDSSHGTSKDMRQRPPGRGSAMRVRHEPCIDDLTRKLYTKWHHLGPFRQL